MKKEKKVEVLSSLEQLVQEYPNFYLVDIEGLPADQTSDLRRRCFASDIKLLVVKNTLLHKALNKVNDEAYAPLYEVLKGNTAVMFCQTAGSPAKVIKEFTKDNKKEEGKPQLKAAYVQESLYVGAQHLDALVNIKSREELIADVVALLQSPIKNVVSALQSGGNTIHGVLQTLQERDN